MLNVPVELKWLHPNAAAITTCSTRCNVAGPILVADVGQGDVPWICLADSEGNEFCVLIPGLTQSLW